MRTEPESREDTIRKEFKSSKEIVSTDMPKPCNLCGKGIEKGDYVVFFTTVVGSSAINIRCAHIECACSDA